MSIYIKKQRWKLLLITTAVIIGISSLWYTNILVDKIADQERKKVELWAEAIRLFADPAFTGDFSFISRVVEDNTTIPAILAEQDGTVISSINLDSVKAQNAGYLTEQIEMMRSEHEPIEVAISGNVKQYIYYKHSILLTKLMYFPYVQLGVISLFIMVSYFAFSYSRKAEQNQVWMGMAKETAHQLGTPLSSLLAWVDVLKLKGVNEKTTGEILQDIKRLEIITDRFSKIGSMPVLQHEKLCKVMEESVEYLKSRVSGKVKFIIENNSTEIHVPLNKQLFGWVIENLCKNAVDAMNGNGMIKIEFKDQSQFVYIDITDTGNGIPKSKYKTIFQPGYSTKHRSWGLGLSLAKRIIENYHNGKIFVKSSETGKGSVFRIVLNK